MLNELRTHTCAAPLPVANKFVPNAKLAKAAQQILSKRNLHEAMWNAGYPADQSALLELSGITDDASLARLLQANKCEVLTTAALTEVGIAARQGRLAIVFAAPFRPPKNADRKQVERAVLDLTNRARSAARRCGTKQFPATTSLKLNSQLDKAAQIQADDMAKRGAISHEGSDGSTPGDRVARSRYAWKAVGENVAAGHLTALEVVAGWLDSPGHCANIMDPNFTEMGVAFTVNARQEIGIYWSQVFARPKSKQ